MKCVKEFKTEDGTTYQLNLSISTDSWIGIMRVNLDVFKKEKGKRKWIDIAPKFNDDWKYRNLSDEGKVAYRMNIFKKEIKPEWVEELINTALTKFETNIKDTLKYLL